VPKDITPQDAELVREIFLQALRLAYAAGQREVQYIDEPAWLNCPGEES
jgi:hypothetical protein